MSLLTIGLCATAIGLSACDEDEDDNYDAGGIPAHFDPGVDADKGLDELGQAEAETLCEAAVTWGQGRLTGDDEALQATCIAAGLAASGSAMVDAGGACETALQDCKTGTFPKAEVCGAEVPAIMGCDQRVQDYQDCFEANTLAYIDAYKDLTCDTLDELQAQKTPAKCAALWDACPALDMRLPGGDGDGGDGDGGGDEDAGI